MKEEVGIGKGWGCEVRGWGWGLDWVGVGVGLGLGLGVEVARLEIFFHQPAAQALAGQEDHWRGSCDEQPCMIFSPGAE